MPNLLQPVRETAQGKGNAVNLRIISFADDTNVASRVGCGAILVLPVLFHAVSSSTEPGPQEARIYNLETVGEAGDSVV